MDELSRDHATTADYFHETEYSSRSRDDREVWSGKFFKPRFIFLQPAFARRSLPDNHTSAQS
jgi:hypothetical protein